MKKRFKEIDLARAVPLLFLPIVHCYEMFTDYGYLNNSSIALGKTFLYLCALGPSVFMIILGMNIAFSSHNSPKELARRGLITIGIFYLHNAIRYIIPASIITIATGEDYMTEAVRGFFISDILLFAGLAFLFFALMKKLKLKPYQILFVTLLLISFNTLIMPKDLEVNLLTIIASCFVHVTKHSAFSLLPWLIYPAIGYILGNMFLENKESGKLKKIYEVSALCSVGILVAACVCMAKYDLNWLLIGASPANDYITDFFNVIIDVSIAFIWFYLSYKAYNFIKNKMSPKIDKFIEKLSKSILLFYLIQWIFVTIAMFIFAVLGYYGSHKLGLSWVIISSIITLVLSLYLSFKNNEKFAKLYK